MSGLNPANDNPAYLAGRLWAYFSALEMATTRDDRISAAKMPAACGHPQVAAKLVNGHLGPLAARLTRKAPRVAETLTEHIAELVGRIDSGTQTGEQTEDQWMFTLGFHHQRPRAEIAAGVLIDTAEVARRWFGGKMDATRMQIKRWMDAGVLSDGYELDGRKWWWAEQIKMLANDRPRASVRPAKARPAGRKD